MSGRRFLARLVTVAGAHRYAQDDLAEAFRRRVRALPGAEPIVQMAGFVHERSEVTHRHAELPIEEIERRDDWYALANQATLSLARRALERLGDLSSCDALVVASSSWAGFPSLGRRLQESAGVPLGAPCWDLAGLGCAAPAQALALADLLLDRGHRKVCVVVADAMLSHGHARRHGAAPTMAQVVAHSIASDGAAALILSSEASPEPRLSYRAATLRSQLWPASLDQNDLTADGANQPLIAVGPAIRTRLLQECAALLDARAVAEPLVMHPGGSALMKIVVAEHPSLAPSAERSLEVLRAHGNLGAASVLFVLERTLGARAPVAPTLRLFALGPGIVATLLALDEAAC